jgi:hypothetical protein
MRGKQTTSERYSYLANLRSRAHAEKYLEDAFASGDINPGEQPEIESYGVTFGNKITFIRWRITLKGGDIHFID